MAKKETTKPSATKPVAEVKKVNEVKKSETLDPKEGVFEPIMILEGGFMTGEEVKKLFPLTNELPQKNLLEVKLDRIIELLEKPKQVNLTKLTEMSLSDLNYLKEMLSRNVTMQNYPGGDFELKVRSNDLIVKIMDEINNRISLYE